MANSASAGGGLNWTLAGIIAIMVIALNGFTEPALPEVVIPECSDGIDNDLNGYTDFPADAGCASADDALEAGGAAATCSNGIDDDGDGYTDFAGGDLGCADGTDSTETDAAYACDDGLNNDGWTPVLIDMADPHCTNPWTDPDGEDDATVECGNGVDDDNWGEPDYADPGCTGETDTSEFDPGLDCDDGVDRDGWGDGDYADPSCTWSGGPNGNEQGGGPGPWQCDDNIDNEPDGNIDALDPECVSADDNDEATPGFQP